MKRRFKTYIKLNMMSLFFIGVSFISVTLAWFAYSGIAKVNTEIDVRAWYVEFNQNGEAVSNNIVVSIPEIYPGMETTVETITVKNQGDSNAELNYLINSVRILDDEYSASDDLSSEALEDTLSHGYPFHINMSLSKKYVAKSDGEATFDITISWPLDSDIDEEDSSWGTAAYAFKQSEENYKKVNGTYVIRPSLKIVLKLVADQYVESPVSQDMDFNEGDLVLYDIASNHSCDAISSTCIITHVISNYSTLGETDVVLLPNIYSDYLTSTYENYSSILNSITSTWNVTTRALTLSDLLNVVSKDVETSFMARPNLSNAIIGNLNYENRLNTEVTKAISYNGYFTYNTDKFSYLDTNRCYWLNTNYNTDKAFAIDDNGVTSGKLYGENKTSTCSVIPVIIAPKINITNE